MVVNLYLNDGRVIEQCELFPEDFQSNEHPAADKNYVWFQTEKDHGKIHVNNIKSYEFFK